MDDEKDPTALSAAVLKNADDHYVVLPCAPSQFGAFVSGLLGKTELLRGVVEGHVDASYQDIENVFHLVHTRVTDQNESSLTHFSITVSYDNGTSVTHNDVKKFETYHPTDNTSPVAVNLDFIYLVNFPASQSPQKQEVGVTLSCQAHSRRLSQHRFISAGAFEYEVKYTNRTWATDIASLLNNHGSKVIEKPSEFSAFVSKYHDLLLNALMVCMFLYVLYSWCVSMLEQYSDSGAGSFVSAELFASFSVNLVVGISVIIGLAAIFILVNRYIDHYLFSYKNSFIVLVEQDKKNKLKVQKKESWQKVKTVLTWIVSIGSGVIANVIYNSEMFLR